MINQIKEILEYRKNKKIVKKELTRIAATTLPVIKEVSNKSADVIKFIMRLTNETQNIEGEKLIELVLSEISNTLQTDQNRIIEILTYIVNLEPQDIQKILVHAVVDTIPNEQD